MRSGKQNTKREKKAKTGGGGGRKTESGRRCREEGKKRKSALLPGGPYQPGRVFELLQRKFVKGTRSSLLQNKEIRGEQAKQQGQGRKRDKQGEKGFEKKGGGQ